MDTVDVVNVVGSGVIPTEFDLEELHSTIGEPESEYDPEKYPGMYIRQNDYPTTTVYRTGKYIIYGANSVEETYSGRDAFLQLLSDIGAIDSPSDSEFTVQNVVCTADLERSLNLNSVAVQLGFENIEYEPEQFPGLIFRPDEKDCVLLIFSSGKVVITGCNSVEIAQAAFDRLLDHLDTL